MVFKIGFSGIFTGEMGAPAALRQCRTLALRCLSFGRESPQEGTCRLRNCLENNKVLIIFTESKEQREDRKESRTRKSMEKKVGADLEKAAGVSLTRLICRVKCVISSMHKLRCCMHR